MSVDISSRFQGPCERREPDGRFESIMSPPATEFEIEWQGRELDRQLHAAWQRNHVRVPWYMRIFPFARAM